MQSYLQYRTFKRNLQRQVDRYGLEKTASAARHQPLQQSTSLPRLPQANDVSEAGAEARDHALEEKELESDGPQPHDLACSRVTDQRHSTSSSDLSTTLQINEEKQQEDDMSESTMHHSDTRSDLDSIANTMSRSSEPDLRHTGTRLGRFMTGISVKSRGAKDNKPNAHEHYFVVGYQGLNDPLNPHNWSTVRRTVYTFLVAAIGFIVGVASSIDSAAAAQFAQDFGVSEVAESLATGLYLIGFGCGAFFAAPFSETVGRNPVYLSTGVLFMIFVMASALAPNIGAQLAFRFLAGFFGSTPLTCAGGSISDMWTSLERTKTFPIFAQAAFQGPVLGPVIGGWIAQSYLSPQWTDWITLIWAGLIFGLVFLFLPETYAPVLLKWKAEHLRELTGDQRYMSALEVDDVTFKDRIMHNLYRPWILVFSEPIVMLFTLYLTVVYVVLFTFLTGFEFIFEQTYGISQGLTFTIFLALSVGFFLAAPLVPFIVKRYRRDLERARQSSGQESATLPPEQRLIFAMIGSPFLPVGIFWMGWTAYPTVSIWSPIIACVAVGFGILCIFITTYQYLIDAFEMHAASALVGITFVRYVAAGAMLPVSIPFYRNLGVHWTLTVLGGISAVLVPVPYLFWIYGERIRGKSRHAVGSSANIMRH